MLRSITEIPCSFLLSAAPFPSGPSTQGNKQRHSKPTGKERANCAPTDTKRRQCFYHAQPSLTSEETDSICFITTYITIRQGIVVISIELNH